MCACLRRTSRDSRLIVLGSQALDQVFDLRPRGAKGEQGAEEDLRGKEKLRRVLDRGIEQRSWEAYAALLRQCGNVGAIEEGRRVHRLLVDLGVDSEIVWGNLVIQMYGKCGCARDAALVFEKMPERNDFSWTLLLTAYAQSGYLLEAEQLLQRMVNPGVVALTIMVTAQAKHGDILKARKLFEIMPERNVVSWNSLITAYARKELLHEAACLFCRMDQDGFTPNEMSFTSVLEACIRPEALQFGRRVHAEFNQQQSSSSSVVVETALVNMYGNCGSTREARDVFDKILNPNSVSWSSIISAYGRNEKCEEAVDMFRRMDLEGVRATDVTFVCVIDACASLGKLSVGKILHGSLGKGKISTDIKVANALVNMYAKCGSVADAKAVFGNMKERNVVSWTALITAYTRGETGDEAGALEAFELFRTMDLEGFNPNEVTLVGVLDACSKMATLNRGIAVHRSIIAMDVVVATSLVNMYAKCGSVGRAWGAFLKFEAEYPNSTDDIVLCNSMLTALVQNGEWHWALDVFLHKKLKGLRPTRITFIAVLAACAQAGLVMDGLQFFRSLAPAANTLPLRVHAGFVWESWTHR